jgi:PAS domain S-box-containing protein
MSDQDIRNQLEGLFSDTLPEPGGEKQGAASSEPEVADLTEAGIEEVEVVNLRQADTSSPDQGTGPAPRATYPAHPKPRWHALRNWPLAARLTLVTILLLLITLAGATFITVRAVRSTLTDQIGQNFVAEAKGLNDLVAVYFLEKVSQLQAVAVTDAVKEALAERNMSYTGSPDAIQAEIQVLDEAWVAAADDDPFILRIITPDPTVNPTSFQLAGYLEAFPDHSEIFVTDRYGATVGATDRLSDYYQADEGWWQAAWNDGEGAIYISDPEYDESAGVTAMLLAVPVINEETGEVIGVARSTLNVNGLYELIAVHTFGQTGHALLLNKAGEIIFDPRLQEDGSVELPADLRQQVANEASNFIITSDQQGDSSLFAFTRLREEGFRSGATTAEKQIIQAVAKLGWATVVQQKGGEALASADQVARSTLLAGVVAALLAGLGVMLITRVTTRPLAMLSAAAEEIGAGNLDTPLPPARGDEVGRLTISFGNMAAQLQQTLATMERRVAERTRARMELAAAVGRRLSTVRDLDTLLGEAVGLIRASFGLYHTQVYLADEAGRYLTLRAGTGQVGAELVRRSHSLPIGPGSINGAAAAEQHAVIVSDTRRSAAFLPNPLLPDTSSEMAVPLLAGGRVVGVLDLQSAQPSALSAENLPAFEALAGQLAIAIENARLFDEAAQAHADAESYVQRLTGAGWEEFMDGIQQPEQVGYVYQAGGLEPLAEPITAALAANALRAPIQVHGAAVGAIQVEGRAGQAWSEAEAGLVESVARQVAQQAENLRLLAEAEQYRIQAEQASRRLTREGWAAYLESQAESAAGFVYDLYQVQPLANEGSGNGAGEPALIRPLQVRGEVIGELAVGGVNVLGDETTELVSVVAERLSDHIENLRLFEESQSRSYELEERGRELEASQRVTFAANESDDPDELLDLVVNLIRDQFNLYHAQVYLVDEQRGTAVLRKSTGYAGRQLVGRGHHIPLDQEASLVVKAIQTGQPVVVDDTSQEPDFLPNPLLPDTRSELVLPLKAGGQVLGALDIQDRAPGRFTPGTVALFSAMAEQVAMNFESADLLVRTTQQAEALTRFTTQLHAAAEVAERVSAILDPEQLLSEVVDLLQSRFGLYHVHTYLLDKAANQLVVRAGSGEVGKVLCERGHHIACGAEKSVVARAARERQTVLIEDTALVSDFMPNPLLPQTRSELALPLVVGDRVLGVLDVQDDQPGRFTQSDLNVFGTLAGQVATALDNARLFEEVRIKDNAIATSINAMVITNLEGQLTYANDAFVKMLGLADAQELSGMAPLDLVPHREDALKIMQAIQTQGSWSGELVGGRKDGSTFDMEVSANIVTDTSGKPIGMLASFLDITERKRAEQALLRLEMAVEQSIDGIAIPDLDGNIQFVNRAWAQMHSYSVEELQGKNLSIFHTEEQLQEDVIPFNEQVMETGANQGEVGHVRKDGTTFPTWMSTTVLKDKEGKPVGLVGTARDITEQKRAEEAVRESQQMLQTVMDNVPQSIFWKDRDLVYLGCNQNFADDAGKGSPEEIIGKTDYDMPWQPQAELYRADDCRVMESGEPVLNYEEPQTTPDGGQIWLRTSKVPLRDARGNVTAVLGAYEDITERKRAEQERERFTTQLSTSADVAAQVGAILDPDQLLNTVISLLKERFGLYYVHFYMLDEAARQLALRAGYGEPGRIMLERGHNIPLDAERSLVARAARSKEIVLVNDVTQEPHFLPNPLLPETRSEVAVPAIAGGVVLGVFDVQHNMPDYFSEADLDVFATLTGQIATALQNAGLFGQVEKSLTETRVRFEVSQALAGAQTEEEVLDALIQQSGLYPKSMVMIFTNDLDVEEEAVVARRIEAFESGLKSIVEPGLRMPVSQFQIKGQFVTPNIQLDERADPVTLAMSKQMGTVSMALLPIMAGDQQLGTITLVSKEEGYYDDLKLHLYQALAEQGAVALHTARLRDEIARTAERLREVDRLKSEFLANMSHELRTPLNSILGYTEVMLMGISGDLPEETLEDVQAIYDNGKHLLRLINDVLDLAKIEAGRLALNIEDVEIAPLLEDVKTNNAGLLVNKPVDMIMEVEDGLPVIRADRTRLSQILNNLVSNAVKFTEAGHVTMRAFQQEEWLCLEVEDTGVGIKESDLETIFEQFHQGDASYKKRAEGTGLGLAITRHLVNMHGGSINVRSQLGQGSTFAVLLPVESRAVEGNDGRGVVA